MWNYAIFQQRGQEWTRLFPCDLRNAALLDQSSNIDARMWLGLVLLLQWDDKFPE